MLVSSTILYLTVPVVVSLNSSILLAKLVNSLGISILDNCADPPSPSSTVPFRRDPHFVDRGDTLKQIDQRCSQPAGRAALVGLGGVG